MTGLSGQAPRPRERRGGVKNRPPIWPSVSPKRGAFVTNRMYRTRKGKAARSPTVVQRHRREWYGTTIHASPEDSARPQK